MSRAPHLRLGLIAAARRSYLALVASPLGPVLQTRPVQALRRRWQHPMDIRDVHEIVHALTGAGVRWWMAGGWGVDALAGTQTRRHKDLDLVVEREDLDTAVAELERRGFRSVPETYPGADLHVADALMPDRRLVQDAAARTVDLHPVDSATWPAGVDEPFTTGRVGSETVPCLSVTCQLAAHRGFEPAAEHQANLRSLEQFLAAGDAP